MIKKFVLIALISPFLTLVTYAQESKVSKVQQNFLTAAETGDIKVFNKLLKSDESLLNIKDEEAMTPLMKAALTGQDVIAKAILKAGKADLEAKNRVGDTALALSLSNEQFEVAKLLVEAGSNIQVKINGSEGVTPFMMAVDNELPLAKLMLKKDKSVLEQQDMNGNTPLLRAVMNENIPAVEYLLSSGANKNHKNKAGLTGALIANKSDNKKLKSVLMK